jgi:hypothetical protein
VSSPPAPPLDPVLTPAELATAGYFPARFRRMINTIAAYYGAPVYLVGSSLTTPDRARDLDVRVILDDLDWERLFGAPFFAEASLSYETPPSHWARLRENLRESRQLSAMYRVRIDFQIQHQAEAEKYEVCVPPRPRLRLDSAPEGFFEAGRPGSVSG